MDSVLILLRNIHNLIPTILRPLSNSKFVGSFCARVALYPVINCGNAKDLLFKEVDKPLSKQPLSVQETKVLNDHLVYTNFLRVMRKFMQHDLVHGKRLIS